MDDYIKREEAIDAFDDPRVDRYYGDVSPSSVIDVIKTIPTADVRENVRGEWNIYDEIYCCSNCGKPAPYDVEADTITYWPNLNFCPNCGADMRGGEKDG